MNILLSIFLLLLINIVLPVPVAGADESGQVSELHDLLLRVEKKVSDFESLQTDFIQEKDLAIFKNKITLKGRIYLQKPHRVAWHVDEPIKYSILITDKYIRQWDEETDRIEEIPISRNPVFSAVTEQLTAWFTGRYVRLLDDYDVRIINKQPLEITFVPKKSAGVKKVIREITVTFREDERYLQKIEFLEVSGDSTTIIFKNTILNTPLDESLFRIGPPGMQGQVRALPCSLHVFSVCLSGQGLS